MDSIRCLLACILSSWGLQTPSLLHKLGNWLVWIDLAWYNQRPIVWALVPIPVHEVLLREASLSLALQRSPILTRLGSQRARLLRLLRIVITAAAVMNLWLVMVSVMITDPSVHFSVLDCTVLRVGRRGSMKDFSMRVPVLLLWVLVSVFHVVLFSVLGRSQRKLCVVVANTWRAFSLTCIVLMSCNAVTLSKVTACRVFALLFYLDFFNGSWVRYTLLYWRNMVQIRENHRCDEIVLASLMCLIKAPWHAIWALMICWALRNFGYSF